MPEENKKGANDDGSPPPDKGAKPGGSPPPEEVQAELKRKTEELNTLKAEKSKSDAAIAELQQKLEEGSITAAEEEELAGEKKRVKDIAKKIRTTKEYGPWSEIIREDSISTASDVVFEYETQKANEFLEDMAVEENFATWSMGKAEFDDAVQKFARALSPHARNYSDRGPHRRNQLGYRAWKREQSRLKGLDDREKTLKEREDEALRFRESGGRVERDKSIDQKMKDADKPQKKMGVLVDLIESAGPGR